MSPGAAGTRVPTRNLHVRQKALVERHNESKARRIDVIATDDRLRSPLQYVDHAPFRPAVAPMALDPYDHSVAVQRFLQVWGRDIHITSQALGRSLRSHESKT